MVWLLQKAELNVEHLGAPPHAPAAGQASPCPQPTTRHASTRHLANMKKRTHTGVVVPGERVAAAATESGSTYLWAGSPRAAVAGHVDDSATVRVSRKRSAAPLPAVGDTIVGRVTRITPRLATVDILCVGEAALREPCAGVLRREDVRPSDQNAEAFEMHRCVRPGDVVLASVLSLGDSRAYYLSTIANEHGVVIARSADGVTMRPVSYCEMQCPKSQIREKRKVAKPATSGAATRPTELVPPDSHS